MQANWSLILNVLMLIGVIVAIGRVMKAKRQTIRYQSWQPTSSQSQNDWNDDVIAVRKVPAEQEPDASPDITLKTKEAPKAEPSPQLVPESDKKAVSSTDNPKTLMMFLVAKDNRQFAGYELLQTILACGLRFGEGQLFHRHQEVSGHGPILFSLAAATATGVFDLQNIGAFNVRGLCLYMHLSNNPGIDQERFGQMLETAKQLSEGLDAMLLDSSKKALDKASISRYQQVLQNRMEFA